MKTDHTPGPWEARTDMSGYYVFAKGRIIEDTTRPRTMMSEADALLIAAAPELLKALMEANEMLEIKTGVSCYAAELALRKATGKMWQELKEEEK